MLNFAAALAMGSMCASMPQARATSGTVSALMQRHLHAVLIDTQACPLSQCRFSSADARQALLDAINGKKGDEEVVGLLRELAKQNPTSAPAKSETIFGKWNLLWASENAEASPDLPHEQFRLQEGWVLCMSMERCWDAVLVWVH